MSTADDTKGERGFSRESLSTAMFGGWLIEERTTTW